MAQSGTQGVSGNDVRSPSPLFGQAVNQYPDKNQNLNNALKNTRLIRTKKTDNAC